jgi:hypothetical protein
MEAKGKCMGKAVSTANRGNMDPTCEDKAVNGKAHKAVSGKVNMAQAVTAHKAVNTAHRVNTDPTCEEVKGCADLLPTTAPSSNSNNRAPIL